MIIKRTFEISNTYGIHARPSASFVKIASRFESDIMVEYDGCAVNGKSILGLMILAAGPGDKIKVTADGKDAEEALEKLGELIESGFNEK
jgi:phosphocarrier protein